MDEKLQRLLGEAARLRLGLTQAEVAEKVGLKSGVYGRVERGRSWRAKKQPKPVNTTGRAHKGAKGACRVQQDPGSLIRTLVI